MFYAFASHSVLATPRIDGEEVELIRCQANNRLWSGKNQACGLNGESCLAAKAGETFKFKCPSDCGKESWTYSKTPVGTEESIYRSFVIGGNNSYRADSFVCGAAVHHGAVSPLSGGCGMIRFTGPKTGFISETKGGIESIGFDTEFPASYEFVDMSGTAANGCKDLRIPIEAINITLGFIYAYFVSDPALFLFPLCIAGFWNVILASNPPLAGGTDLADAELISLGFRRLLPCLLGVFLIYKFSTYPQLKNVEANLTRAVAWNLMFWVGIMENYVFGALPLDRLTVSDLNAQPGAWMALTILVSIIVAIALGQAYIIWRAGKFIPYIKLYLGMIAGLAVLAMVPNQTLRIHHYILALLLLPGTGFPNTPSMLYQGILVGLFIAGIARWDFDSILQTYDQLRRGAPSLRGGLPTFLEPLISEVDGYILQWSTLDAAAPADLLPAWDGFSLIIDDVERYRGPETSFNLTDWALSTGMDIAKAYIRLAYTLVRDRGQTGDYTRAAVAALANRTWTPPPPGRL